MIAETTLAKVKPQTLRTRAGIIRVVLPAYNEEKALPALLNRLEQSFEEAGLKGEVLVVNDGSTDATAQVVRDYATFLPVRLLDLQPNRGLAGAIKAGLFATVSECNPGDIILTMDADNTHTPGLILRMVQMIREGNDIVIASRYQSGSRILGVSTFRKFLSYGASVLFRLIARMPGVRDYTCGYRAYRAELLQVAVDRWHDEFIQQTGFSCMVEILLKLKALDPIVNEVPLILRYDLKPSASQMNIWRTIKETLMLSLRYSLKRISVLSAPTKRSNSARIN